MVPDISPADGVQPEPQFVPPHVRLGDGVCTGVVVGTGVVEVVVGSGVVGTGVVVVGTGVVGTGEVVVGTTMLHIPVKPGYFP
jgi:hypothetical protein